jgi:hypothetical protein
VAFWFAVVFLLGLLAGSASTWWLLDGRVIAPTAAPLPHPSPTVEEDVPDSMSLTAQRLVSDLEKKYEGVTSAADDAEAKPKRPRAPRKRRPAPEEPS